MQGEQAKARTLGFGMVLALVVGNMIGSGIYLLPATLAPLGWNQLAGWMVTIIGALSLAAVFAALARSLPRAGGPYAYAEAAFGPLAGFVAAWSYWVMTWVGNGAIAVAVVSNLSLVAPVIGKVSGLPAVLAVACVWVLTMVNISGVKAAGRVQEVTTGLKIIPLVVLIGLALVLLLAGAPHAPDPGVPFSADKIATAAGLTFWGFLGLESGTVPADKVDDATHTVPRATMLGVALTGAIYFGISLAFALFMPLWMADSRSTGFSTSVHMDAIMVCTWLPGVSSPALRVDIGTVARTIAGRIMCLAASPASFILSVSKPLTRYICERKSSRVRGGPPSWDRPQASAMGVMRTPAWIRPEGGSAKGVSLRITPNK